MTPFLKARQAAVLATLRTLRETEEHVSALMLAQRLGGRYTAGVVEARLKALECEGLVECYGSNGSNGKIGRARRLKGLVCWREATAIRPVRDLKIETLSGSLLSAAVAENIMGWTWRRPVKIDPRGPAWAFLCPPGDRSKERVPAEPEYPRKLDFGEPQYATEPDAMFALLAEMEKRGLWAQLQSAWTPGGLCWAGFTPHGFTGWNGRADYRSHGTTLPEAVARAALLYVAYAPGLPPEEGSE